MRHNLDNPLLRADAEAQLRDMHKWWKPKSLKGKRSAQYLGLVRAVEVALQALGAQDEWEAP